MRVVIGCRKGKVTPHTLTLTVVGAKYVRKMNYHKSFGYCLDVTGQDRDIVYLYLHAKTFGIKFCEPCAREHVVKYFKHHPDTYVNDTHRFTVSWFGTSGTPSWVKQAIAMRSKYACKLAALGLQDPMYKVEQDDKQTTGTALQNDPS